MSARHPIITVTGTAGDATEAVRETFAHIFDRERIAGAFIDGSGFHRYDRAGMEKARREAQAAGDRYFAQIRSALPGRDLRRVRFGSEQVA